MDDYMIRMMRLAQKGYVCSQIVMQLVLDMRHEQNPGLIRAMAGPGYGCGFGQGTCGALVGGACVLAFYAAKGADDERESEQFMPMLQALSDWFAQTVGVNHGGITCALITGESGPGRSVQNCSQIVSATFSKTIEILVENGIDLLE